MRKREDTRRNEEPKHSDHDIHGTPFRRVPGPGPKDKDAGAEGMDSKERRQRR